MVFGAFAAIFGADCGKRRPTQVHCGRPLGLYTAVRLCGRQKRTKSTGKLWGVLRQIRKLGVIPRAHARYLAHLKLLFPVRVRTVNNGPK